jgi:hypothetical protein
LDAVKHGGSPLQAKPPGLKRMHAARDLEAAQANG